MTDHEIRYIRAQGLAASALDAMATHSGNIRERLYLVDPEFFMLSSDQLPDRDGIREAHGQLRKRLTRLSPRDDEGTLAATIRKARLQSLEQDAALLLSLCNRLCRNARSASA